MSAPLVPSPLDYIGRRTFGFYPPIRQAGPNIWVLGASSWSEVQVINPQSGRELWVPRQYVGAVSDFHDALTVGLTQDLEALSDTVAPRSLRRVLVMPPCSAPAIKRERPANVISIRLEESKPAAFHCAPVRFGICLLFVTGLLALVAGASR